MLPPLAGIVSRDICASRQPADHGLVWLHY
jgi:hypothetical protein